MDGEKGGLKWQNPKNFAGVICTLPAPSLLDGLLEDDLMNDVVEDMLVISGGGGSPPSLRQHKLSSFGGKITWLASVRIPPQTSDVKTRIRISANEMLQG